MIKQKANKQLKLLPNLKLTSLDSLTINVLDFIEPNKSVIISLFNTDCDHCKQELKEIMSIISNVDINVILISSEPIFHVKKYIKENNLQKSSINFAIIDEDKVFETFGAVSFPHILIYNSKGELKKKFMGEVKAETILNYIE